LDTFPFGMPIEPLVQRNRGRKRVFVLGVYASAVHARWVDADGRTVVTALAVASEPEIFWRGEDADRIVSRIAVPAGAGRLVPAGARLNGPSGRALDDLFLSPLGIGRQDAWLCDLLPFSRRNERQAAALARAYDPQRAALGLPAYRWPPVPSVLSTPARRAEIEDELREASPDVAITLGDQPLKWFTSHFGSQARLGAYGETPDTYGRLHPLRIAGRDLLLLPLVHPRQAGGLGTHSSRWGNLHAHWATHVASSLLSPSA
jgi:uracil-DNA glycosylase